MNRYEIIREIPENPVITGLRERQKQYEDAGLTKKADECNIEIKTILAGSSYPIITLKDIYKELFGKDLNAIMADFGAEHVNAIKLGAIVAAPYLRKPPLTEPQLWQAIDENSYRFVDNEFARQEFLRRLLPHIRKTSTQDLLKNILEGLEQKKQKPQDKAVIKIEEWSESTANMDLSTGVIDNIKKCMEIRLFDKICVAYGVIASKQCTDILIFSAISNKIWELPMTVIVSGIGIIGDIPGTLFKISIVTR